jgi:hypothetical protein
LANAAPLEFSDKAERRSIARRSEWDVRPPKSDRAGRAASRLRRLPGGGPLKQRANRAHSASYSPQLGDRPSHGIE